MSTGPVRADPLAQPRERTRAPDARTRSYVAYGAVAGAIAAAMLAHLKVLPSLGIVAPLLPFIPAVLLGAWLGGLVPGLVATLLGGAAGAYVLLAPEFSLDAIARDVVGLVLVSVALSHADRETLAVQLGRGLLQVEPHGRNGGARSATAEERGQIERRLFRNVAGETHDQYRVVSNLRRLFAKPQQRDEQQNDG